MHSKISCINTGGVNFLKRIVDEGNAMSTLFLGIVKFLNSIRPFHSYKLLRDVANTKNPIALYVFAMTEHVFFNKIGPKVLIQLFKIYLKKSTMISYRDSFIKMLNNKVSKNISKIVVGHKKGESHWNNYISIIGENEMYARCPKYCISLDVYKVKKAL